MFSKIGPKNNPSIPKTSMPERMPSKANTKEFVMMELTDNYVGQNRKLKGLRNQHNAPISKVGEDKSNDSYDYHEV